MDAGLYYNRRIAVEQTPIALLIESFCQTNIAVQSPLPASMVRYFDLESHRSIWKYFDFGESVNVSVQLVSAFVEFLARSFSAAGGADDLFTLSMRQ